MMEMICLDFLNSEFRDFRGRWVEDRLYRPEWLEEFCARWGLRVAEPADAVRLAEFERVRTLLRGMVERIAGGQSLMHHDLAALNSLQVLTPVVRYLVRSGQEYRVELYPLEKDWNWVVTEIVASFAELLARHDPRRLKICGNSHCLAVFYDESKNRTRVLCSEKCSNLLKAERFRARHGEDSLSGLGELDVKT